MLGVFALVVMTSVLDGVLDKVGTGFAGMSWDGTVVDPAEGAAETTEEQKRFAMSPGLRYEDLARIAAPHEGALAFLPRATKRTARARRRRHRAHLRHRRHPRLRAPHEPPDRQRPRPHRRRPAAAQHRRRRRRDSRRQALRRRRSGRARRGRRRRSLPHRRRAGARPDLQRGALPRRQRRHDPARDVHGPDGPASHKLTQVAVKLRRKSDLADVSALVLGRAKQAHHGIEDVEIKDLEAEAARS